MKPYSNKRRSKAKDKRRNGRYVKARKAIRRNEAGGERGKTMLFLRELKELVGGKWYD